MTFDNWRGLVTGTLKNTRHYPMLEIDEGRGAKLRGGPLRGSSIFILVVRTAEDQSIHAMGDGSPERYLSE